MKNKNQNKFRDDINSVMNNLDSSLKEWMVKHLIEPRKIKLSVDTEGKTIKEYWLITDHGNFNNSSYRIVFNPETSNYGLECSLESNVNWYMGDYGSLYETIMSL